MAELWTNNAKSTLAAGILAADTTLTVQAGYGFLFPQPSAPDYFYCTLDNGVDLEIVKVRARSGDVFSTIDRGQQGTTARDWAGGDKVELRLTRRGIEDLRIEDVDMKEVLIEILEAIRELRDLVELFGGRET